MKGPKQQETSETAPSTGQSGYDTKSILTDRQSRQIYKAEVSYISCLSLKSDFSRGEPPTFSTDPPNTQCKGPHQSEHDLQQLKRNEESPEQLVKDCLIVQSSKHFGGAAVLPWLQRQLKSWLKQTYEPLLEGTRSSTVCVRDALSAEPIEKLPDVLSSGSVRTLLTVGSAGVGKSVLVQKIMVDWCEDKDLQHIQLLLPLPVSQLNLLQQHKWTLMELLQTFCPGLRESSLTELSHYRVLFVLDALEECRLKLDFSKHQRCEAESAVPVDTLLSQIILGNLLPNAQVWIISRPGAAHSIPPELIHRVTEVIGFSDRQQELHLLQNIQNIQKEVIVFSDHRQELHHLQNIQTVEKVSDPCGALRSMYFLPLFCSITASVPQPHSVAQLFLHFLFYQMKMMKQRYGLRLSRVSTVVQALSRLAHQQLQRGELQFSEEELTACGLEVPEAILYSGLCSQTFTEDACGGHWTFSFLHQSLQEFLSALFLHMSGHRDELNGALRDRPMVLHFLQELSMESSVSLLTRMDKHRDSSPEIRRPSAQFLEQDEVTVSASGAKPQTQSMNPVTKRNSVKSSLCRSQARVNGEGHEKRNLWKMFICSIRQTVEQLRGSRHTVYTCTFRSTRVAKFYNLSCFWGITNMEAKN